MLSNDSPHCGQTCAFAGLGAMHLGQKPGGTPKRSQVGGTALPSEETAFATLITDGEEVAVAAAANHQRRALDAKAGKLEQPFAGRAKELHGTDTMAIGTGMTQRTNATRHAAQMALRAGERLASGSTGSGCWKPMNLAVTISQSNQ